MRFNDIFNLKHNKTIHEIIHKIMMLNLLKYIKNAIKFLLNKYLLPNHRLSNSVNNLKLHPQSNELQKKYSNIGTLSKSLVLETWFGRKPFFYGYNTSAINALSTDLLNNCQFYLGNPGCKIFSDIVYVPKYQCFYSTEGLRIIDDCLYNPFEKSNLLTKTPEFLNLPKTLPTFSQEIIYGSYSYLSHYGHFLTDGISRLWYLAQNSDFPILLFLDKQMPINQYFLLNNFFSPMNQLLKRFIDFVEPVKLKTLIVPFKSFTTPNAGCDAHKILPEFLAEKMLSKTKIINSSQPLYFSRTKLSNTYRKIIGENKLEEKLREANFKIIYPETISLKKQIELINKHEVIVSTIGSALHNILFDISSRRNIVCLGYEEKFNYNYFIIDAIKNVNSHYISALTFPFSSELEKQGSQQNRAMKLDLTISGLKEIGLFS